MRMASARSPRTRTSNTDPSTVTRWLSFGGEATCRSYGVDAGALLHDPHALQTRIQAAIPERHRTFLTNLRRTFLLEQRDPDHHQDVGLLVSLIFCTFVKEYQ